MKSIISVAALATVVPAVLAQNSSPVSVNSLSSVVTCEPVKFMWSGGTPPYYLSLIPAEQPSAPPMKIFPVQQGTSYTWIVDLQAGTAFTTEIKDSSGQPNYSGEQIVTAGPSTSCTNANITETNTSGNGPATPAPSGSASPAAAVVTGSGSGSAAPSSTGHPSSSGTPSNTAPVAGATHTNAAGHATSIGAIGVAGVLGLIGAAFL